MKKMKCNKCGDLLTVERVWHDKENRSMNHLPIRAFCCCGGGDFRASSVRELRELHRDISAAMDEIEVAPTLQPKAGVCAWLRRLANARIEPGRCE